MIGAYILGLALAFAFAKLGIRPSRKRIVRQRRVPFANNLRDLSRRAHRRNVASAMLCVCALALSACKEEPVVAVTPTATATDTAETEPPAPARLRYVDQITIGAGFHWTEVTLVEDGDTGRVYVIARTKDGVSVTTAPEVRP